MAEEYYAGDDGGNWDYVPEDTGFYDTSYDPNQYSGFDLASLLADQGIIPFDDYGAPDLSALYDTMPDFESVINGGVSPEELSGITGSLPTDMLYNVAAINPGSTDEIQDLGNGMYQVGDKMLDSVQLMDYINGSVGQNQSDMNFMRSVAGMGTGEPGLKNFSTYALQGKGDGMFDTKHDALTAYVDQNGNIMSTGDADAQKYMDGAYGLRMPGAPVGAEGYAPGFLEELLSRNTDPAAWADNQGRGYKDWLSAAGEDRLSRNSTGDWNPINAAANRSLTGGSQSKGTASLNLQQALKAAASGIGGGTKALTKGQTGINTASALAMLAAALGGGGGKSPDGNKERGADGWKISRAAGSGRVNKAAGGSVGGLSAVAGKAIGHVQHRSRGQADIVPANLSGGEYVMDADVVSALGDGNTEAGAAELDKMREAVRKHKRSAPANKIPPQAKSPLEYMKRGAK